MDTILLPLSASVLLACWSNSDCGSIARRSPKVDKNFSIASPSCSAECVELWMMKICKEESPRHKSDPAWVCV